MHNLQRNWSQNPCLRVGLTIALPKSKGTPLKAYDIETTRRQLGAIVLLHFGTAVLYSILFEKGPPEFIGV